MSHRVNQVSYLIWDPWWHTESNRNCGRYEWETYGGLRKRLKAQEKGLIFLYPLWIFYRNLSISLHFLKLCEVWSSAFAEFGCFYHCFTVPWSFLVQFCFKVAVLSIMCVLTFVGVLQILKWFTKWLPRMIHFYGQFCSRPWRNCLCYGHSDHGCFYFYGFNVFRNCEVVSKINTKIIRFYDGFCCGLWQKIYVMVMNGVRFFMIGMSIGIGCLLNFR